MSIITEKLGEVSTWEGILLVVGSAGGWYFSEALTASIAAFGVALVGLISIIRKERQD